ncbi:hypothetical protein MUP56_02695 [Patescibacteria group bacterium]|nr:hypothetical protein [Patescibacteria group bacterium]
MKNGLIGLLVVSMIVASGIVLSTGHVIDNKATEGLAVEIPQTNTPTTDTTLTNTESQIEVSAPESPAAPEKVSVEALECTIVRWGYNLNLRFKNPSTQTRTVNINPIGREVVLRPGDIKLVDLLLGNDDITLNILVDNGDKLSVQPSNCISRGGSNSGFSSLQSSSNPELPPPPVPELPTIALMGLGVFGLLFMSRRIK